MLQTLRATGNVERLLDEARRILGQEPEDEAALFHLVTALSGLKRHREARPHLDALLRIAPVEVNTLVAAVDFHLSAGKLGEAGRFATEGMRIDPEWPYFHFTAAVIAARQHRLHEARRHIARARELEPHDPDTVNLYIRLHAAMETTAKEALVRLRQYEEALQLDPGNAALHNSIGDVHLNELADPVKAEEHYRLALRSEPANADYQRDLFEAVAQRSLIYRLFSLPSKMFEYLKAGLLTLRREPWVLIFWIIGFKLVLGFMVWLALATLLLWPGCKVYEWFVVSELRAGSATPVPMLSLWLRIRRHPLWLRFGVFLACNGLIWALLFSLAGIPLDQGFLAVGGFVAIHLAVLILLRLVRRYNAWQARRERIKAGAR
jgi:tetratricopeptide (TPR) repeat protein